MKAEELMIGDWVMYDPIVEIEDEQDEIRKPFPTQIKNGEDIDYAIEGGYSPIPLTEEILLKNGWTTDGHETGLYRGKPYFGVVTIYAYMGKTWDLFDGNVTIQYVHELQHAINLCGLIKDIKL